MFIFACSEIQYVERRLQPFAKTVFVYSLRDRLMACPLPGLLHLYWKGFCPILRINAFSFNSNPGYEFDICSFFGFSHWCRSPVPRDELQTRPNSWYIMYEISWSLGPGNYLGSSPKRSATSPCAPLFALSILYKGMHLIVKRASSIRFRIDRFLFVIFFFFVSDRSL